jgi:hypothetical protein
MTEIQLKGGHTTKDRRLDRIPFFDDRSRAFQVRRLLGSGYAPLRRRRSIVFGPGHDQGREGACTGFGAVHAAQSKPHSRGILTPQIAREWYFDNQKIDYWPGGAYPGASPFYEGSSVLATMQTGVARGMWGSFWWVGAGSQTVVQDIIDATRHVGPVVFGLNWHESMFYPSPSGVVEVDLDSEIFGGHCVAAQDCLYMKPAGHPYGLYLAVQQSWGPDHGASYRGVPGFILIRVDDNLEGLMHEDGEGAVAVRATPAQLASALA